MILTVPSPRLATTNLVQAALDGGSRDNVTAIVADVVDGPPVVGTGMVLGAAIECSATSSTRQPSRPLRSA